MSSIFGLLNVGATGIAAHGFGVAVSAQNAQNAATEGYTRRDVRLSPLSPPPLSGGGVTVRGTRRIQDQLLEKRLLGATSEQFGAKAKQSALGVLDRALSDVEGGLGQSYDDFTSALADLVGRPSDPAARGQVLATAGRLAGAFNEASQRLSDAQADIDSQIETTVTDINTQLHAIGDLGVAIQKAEVSGQEASDLRDQRDQLLRELSQKIPISTVTDPSGATSVLLGGSQALVSPDGRVSELVAQPDATTGRMSIAKKAAGQLVDVGGLVTSGEMGGLLSARDGAIADAMSALDQLAFDVAGAYNAAHAAGYGTDGGTGRALFSTTATASGAAAALAVSSDVAGFPDRVAAATDPALTAGDNRNAIALAALSDTKLALGGSAKVDGALGALMASAGEAVRGASLDARITDDAASQLSALRESVSGVSVDEEMINLAKFQRGYQASLRIISTADEMLQELVAMGRH
ncbi:MAG: flagellar hook-associated protein FlgK [Sandaracinaceae bacterium]